MRCMADMTCQQRNLAFLYGYDAPSGIFYVLSFVIKPAKGALLSTLSRH
jgi:hypothetical protein